jgi:hypothetical protein
VLIGAQLEERQRSDEKLRKELNISFPTKVISVNVNCITVTEFFDVPRYAK